MENKIDDGGPAMPCLQEIDRWHEDKGKYVSEMLPVGGMSLRQWFAGQEKTLPFDGWVADYFNEEGINGWSDLTPERKKEALVTWRYEMADAMIAMRKAKP